MGRALAVSDAFHGPCLAGVAAKNPANSSRPPAGRDGLPDAEGSRRWFAALLWRAFPGPSEAAVAEKAARVLDVSPRQVRNWLRGEHCAALKYVAAVLAVAGVEVLIDPARGRR